MVRERGNIFGRLLRGDDLDDVFAYTTTKEVAIRDRRLGMMDGLFKMSILFGYIFLYQIIYQKSYLDCYSPTAQISASLSYLTAVSDEQCKAVSMERRNGAEKLDNFLNVAETAGYCNKTYGSLSTSCGFHEVADSESHKSNAISEILSMY